MANPETLLTTRPQILDDLGLTTSPGNYIIWDSNSKKESELSISIAEATPKAIETKTGASIGWHVLLWLEV